MVAKVHASRFVSALALSFLTSSPSHLFTWLLFNESDGVQNGNNGNRSGNHWVKSLLCDLK